MKVATYANVTFLVTFVLTLNEGDLLEGERAGECLFELSSLPGGLLPVALDRMSVADRYTTYATKGA